MKFKFIGADGSLGFKKGKIYCLKTKIEHGLIFIYYGIKCCPYQSIESFLANWERGDT